MNLAFQGGLGASATKLQTRVGASPHACMQQKQGNKLTSEKESKIEKEKANNEKTKEQINRLKTSH